MTDSNPTMINRLTRLMLTASILLLAACSDSGGSSGSDSQEVEALQAGDTVEVFEGDQLEQTSDDARVQVRHEEGTDRKFVTILAGSAELVRGDFYESR